MKKNLLALSIAAMVGGIAGGANAQSITDTIGARTISNSVAIGALAAPAVKAETLSPTATGIGHILVVPYFTTQGSNMTLLNLVNNDKVNGKAVKLRFRGAANSDDLFDISIFLSPGDVWAANVSANGDISAITTNDNTCTLPSAAEIKEQGGKFVKTRVLNNEAAETREGYVEILNMADIPPATGATALFTAIKHVAGKAPCTQATMDLQANPLSADPTSPDFAANNPATRGYSWPTGGLSANWTIVNTGNKASFSGEAVALRATPARRDAAGLPVLDENGFWEPVTDKAAAANIVFSPQTTARVNNTTALTADPLLQMVNGPVRAASYDFPDLSTPYTFGSTTPEVQAGELANVLRTKFVNNEFVTDPSVSFATDWVFSMPTRRYAVAMDYAAKKMVFNSGVNQHFTLANTSLDTKTNRICVDAGQLTAFDREEQSRTTFVISPNDVLKFCGETSVLTFNGKASVLGASLTTNDIPTKFVDGWLNIQTPGLGRGLPVVGFAVGKAVDGTQGNFGGTWMHRTNRFGNQPF